MYESIAHAAPGKAETRSEFFENCRFCGFRNNKGILILNYLKFPDKIAERISKAHYSHAFRHFCVKGTADDYVNGPDLTGNVEALFIFWRT